MRDVAIVGGGPGGLSAARRLAADGWSVTVFEEHERIGTPVHCTGVLAEDVIASMDLPAEAVLNPLSTVRFVAPAGHSFDYTTATTEAVVIDRAAFDRALADRASSAGATIVRGRRVIAHRSVAATASTSRSPMATIVRARGGGPRLRRQLRVPEAARARHAVDVPAVGAARAARRAARRRRDSFRIGNRAEGICVGGAGAAARGHLRAHRRDGRRRCGRVFFEDAGAGARARGAVAVPDRRSRGGACCRSASVKRSYADRVLAVGDAAGLVKPTTGGGIYYSVVSGEIAAEVLASRLATNDLSAAAMQEYEQRWRGRFQSEFTAQLALRFVAQRMRDTDIDALFTLATTDGILPLVRQTARFNRHRDFILALLRHQPARRALFGRLASSV